METEISNIECTLEIHYIEIVTFYTILHKKRCQKWPISLINEVSVFKVTITAITNDEEDIRSHANKVMVYHYLLLYYSTVWTKVSDI